MISRRSPRRRSTGGLRLLLVLGTILGCSSPSTDVPSNGSGTNGTASTSGSAAKEFPGSPVADARPEAAPLDAGARTAAGSADEAVELNPEGIPIVSAGRPINRSAVADAPGFTPLDDPELESVERGRRLVDPLPDSVQLSDAPGGRRALAEAIVEAVNAGDAHRLDHLRITFEEFRDIYWREDPSSRPITQIPAEESWGFLWRSSVSGAKRMVEDHGGRGLTLDRIEYRVGVTPFANFDLYRGVRLVCTDGDGNQVNLDSAYTWIERDGRCKVYIYKD